MKKLNTVPLDDTLRELLVTTLVNEKGMTARAVAIAAGISPSRMNDLRQGRVRLGVTDLLTLCDALEITPEYALARARDILGGKANDSRTHESSKESIVETQPDITTAARAEGVSADEVLASAVAELSQVVGALRDVVVAGGVAKQVGIPELAVDAPVPVRTEAEQARIDSALAHPERAAASTPTNTTSEKAGLEEGSGA